MTVQAKWALDWWETERGWGQKFWYTETYDSKEDMQAAMDENDESHDRPVTPDWYCFYKNPRLIEE